MNQNLTKSEKRSRRFIEPKLQGRLLRRLLIYALLYNFILLSVMAGEQLFRQLPRMLNGHGGFSLEGFMDDFFSNSRALILAMLVVSPAVLRDMISFSHRFVGPLQRFRGAMEQYLHTGELKSVQLRDGDFLDDFQATFNRFAEKIREQQAIHPAQAEQLHRILEVLEAHTQNPASDVPGGTSSGLLV